MNLPSFDDSPPLSLPPLDDDDADSLSPPSPLLRNFSVLDEDDDFLSPPSPSLRNFSVLDDEDDFFSPPPPPSPGHLLLSLPGAEVDEDLISADLGSASSPPPASLLFDEPEPDISPPRSPSSTTSDDLDLLSVSSLTLSASYSEEAQRLVEIKKRFQASARASKSLEKHFFESGLIQLGNEARRARKREKERCKEVSSLLRLKLGNSSSPKQQKPGKVVIKTMPQLVAKMLFRRHEAAAVRPLSNANPPLERMERWKKRMSLLAS